MNPIRLSKSKIITGIQCEKALYLSIHRPDLADEISDSQQLIFDQGHEVGILAQSHYPGGVRVDAPHTDTKLALKQTEDAITNGALYIYEATFSFNEVLVKVDILTRKSKKHDWEIVEVKSSTEVKDVYLQDAAIQLYVCRGAGIKVKTVSVMTINNECTYPNLKNLFNLTDVTKTAEDLQDTIPKRIKKFNQILQSKTQPEKSIGPQCDDPYSCVFKTECWSKFKIPEISVFDIPRLSTKRKWEYFNKGKIKLKDLDLKEFNAQQKLVIELTVANTRFIDPKGISKALKAWKYPFSFLDFETIGFAIPRYNGQRPYQQIPFQFSCHIQNEEGAKLEHREYLHTEDTDPRKEIAKALIEMVPKTGSVIAYNMGFEGMVLKGLAELFPKLNKQLLSIADRLVDPLPIFREHVYDPAFAGSFSIKTVAPALLGNDASYEGMAVADGGEAQSAYMEMIDSKTSAKRKEELRRGLIEYCTKDTMGMVQLVSWLLTC